VQDFSVTVNKLMVTNIREQISEMFPLPSLRSTGWFKEWKLSMIYKSKKNFTLIAHTGWYQNSNSINLYHLPHGTFSSVFS